MFDIKTDEAFDEDAVDKFSASMRDKMAQKRQEGRGGWWDSHSCDLKKLERLLLEHVEKYGSVDAGDIDPHQLVDIANLTMMLWWRTVGQSVLAESDSENTLLKKQLATVTEQRDRAWAAIRYAFEHESDIDWCREHEQAITEARENGDEEKY